MSQAKLLTDIKDLSALTLEEPSASLMHVLCNWVGCLGEHLISLTLKVCIGSDDAYLSSTVDDDTINFLEIARS